MVPTLCTVIAVFYFALPKQKKHFQFSDGVWVIESLYFEVRNLLFAYLSVLFCHFHDNSCETFSWSLTVQVITLEQKADYSMHYILFLSKRSILPVKGEPVVHDWVPIRGIKRELV
jgi:hypothetical protein